MIDIIGLPAFCFTVFVMFWSLPLLCVTGYLRPLQLTGGINYPWGWAEGLGRFQKVRVLKINDTPVYGDGKVIFLCNHRSWADFFMDVYMTAGRGMMLSRMAVAYVFPMFMAAVRSIRGVILFKRGRIVDKEGFNKWIDRELEQSPQCGLIVYPEGHRNTLPGALPLKRGMLYYAHSRGLPVQVVITVNKELMLSEKYMTARFGVTLAVAHSAVVRSAEFAGDSGAFFAEVQRVWDETWATAYSADLSALPEFKPAPMETDPPLRMRLAFLAYALLVTACMGGTLYGCARLALAGMRLLPPAWQAGTTAALLAWCTASYVHVHMAPIAPAAAASPAAAVGNGVHQQAKTVAAAAAVNGGSAGDAPAKKSL